MVAAIVPRSDWLRTTIPENARRRLKERNLSKDRLNRISLPPKKTPQPPNKHSTSRATESQTAVRLRSEPLKFPPSVASPAKSPMTPFMQAVSETGCLLPLYQCRLTFVQLFSLLYLIFRCS